MAKLTDEEVRTALSGLQGWELVGAAIEREYRFPGFADAVAFVVRLGFAAEAADHHPDLDIRYDRVRVSLSTHSQGGVTVRDLELAQQAQALAAAAGAA